MSGGPPDVPEIPPPPPGPGEGGRIPVPRGGSMVYGVLSGALMLYVVYVGALMFIGGPFAWSGSILAGWATFIPVVLYLLLAVPLAARRETSRFGTGMLIGLGVFTLLGGGLCIGSLAQAGS
jgi:hypothetical protein